MKKYLFLILIGLANQGVAHDFGSQLGSDVSSTDYLRISCDSLADKVHLEISSSQLAGAPIVSAQIFKENKAKNISSQGLNSIDFQGGGGVYDVTVNKNKTGVAAYALVYHCEDANREHTETGLDEIQNQ